MSVNLLFILCLVLLRNISLKELNANQQLKAGFGNQQREQKEAGEIFGLEIRFWEFA